MRYTKSAKGFLNKQYISVLKKCLMINLGVFVLTGTANAEYANLKEAVDDGTVTTRQYKLNANENVAATLGTMAAGQLTIDGNTSKFGINADQEAPAAVGGITVGAGNTLILQNLGSYTVSGEGTAVTDYTVNSSVNGFVSAGGGFLNNSGTATISDVVFYNNIANTDTGGGAIFNSGAITEVSNAAFIQNKANTSWAYGAAINNDGGTIGNISGKFIGNEASYGGAIGVYSLGGVIQNLDGQIGNINGDFIGNSAAASYLYGGVIYNGVYYSATPAIIGDISGRFENNSAVSDSTYYAIIGSVISNATGQMGNVSADFKNNTATAENGIVAGILSNQGTIGNISGNFEDNRITAGLMALGFLYNDEGKQMGTISADFKGNSVTGSTVYGGVMNQGTINQIVGSTFEGNISQATTGNAVGGALMNYSGSAITNGLVNVKFLDNAVISGSGASGGAIYSATNLAVIADGSVGDGVSTFKGNYYQVTGGDKIYEAVWMSGASRVLTLEAKNGGTINLYDYISGSAGFDTVITGDSTGTVNLYNDIKRSDVSIEKVDVNTADGTLHGYPFRSLNSDAAVKWKIDIDTKNQEADVIATSTDAASAGTITLNELNYVDSSTADIVEGFKVQILKTQGDTIAADLQLALSDDLKEKFVISQTENTHTDEVTASTKWSDEFKKTGTITTTSGQYGLATTDTLNDSIAATLTTDTEQVDEKVGDTLAMVNQAELADKTFSAAKADDVYKAEDDLGETSGNVTIKGVASGENKSTVDLDGHNGFVIGDGASVTLTDVKLTDGAGKAGVEVAEGGKLTMQNASLDKIELKVDGELNAGNNKITAKKAAFGKNATLKLMVNNIKDNYGVFTADSFDIAQGAKLDVTFGQNPLDGRKSGEIALLTLSDGSDINNNNFTDNFHNNMFGFTRKSDKSGIYGVYQTKTAEEISRENGGTKTNQAAAAAWIDKTPAVKGIAREIADDLFELLQTDGVAFNEELTAIAPNDNGMVQIVSADVTDRLMITVDNHLFEPELEKQTGLASGDSYLNNIYRPRKNFNGLDLSGIDIWAKGYYGKSKLQRSANIYGFDTESQGIIAGIDRKMTSSVKIGIGIQYEGNDIDAFKRHVDAKSTLGFLYGEYRPSKWFMNGVLSYGATDYDERKYVVNHKISAHYKSEIYSLQGLAGYTFKYFTPEIGARYYKIKRHGYVDSIGQKVSGENMDLLRMVAGVKISDKYGIFKPTAYFGATYDAISDRDNAFVSVTDGVGYKVYGKRLPRFGVEFGTDITAAVTDKFEVSLGYEAKFREKYQDHIGMINVKYEF